MKKCHISFTILTEDDFSSESIKEAILDEFGAWFLTDEEVDSIEVKEVKDV